MSEQGQAECIGDVLPPAFAEEGRAISATRAEKIAHVFDYAEDGNFDFAKHFNAAMYVFERDILRGGDYDRTAEWYGLGKGELCIARAGG